MTPDYWENTMAKQEVTGEVLLKRLKRIEGQVRGIQKLIENNRPCETVITQLLAVRSAVDGVAGIILKNYMKICFDKEGQVDHAEIESLARAIAIWGRIRIGDSP